MIPAWLIRFLPHGLAALAVIGAVWWIDQNAAERTRMQIDARAKASENRMRSDLRKSEQRLAVTIGTLGSTYEQGRAAREAGFAALQTDILKEIAREKRLSDPAAGLTRGMLETVNRARASSACAATAAGRIECAVPGPAPGR